MALDLTNGEGQFSSELDFMLHFQNVLLRAVEGARDDIIEAEYKRLRSALMAEPKYAEMIPEFVRRHRDLGSLWPTLKSYSPQWEPRRIEVRRQFEPAIAEADRIDPFGQQGDAGSAFGDAFDSSAWTGATTTATRLAAVKTLLPVARAAVERLIENLDAPGHNGGPPLDGTIDALESLRALHKVLGEILDAAAEGKLDAVYHSGMVMEASRYARRAAKQLRDDPMPYATAALLLGVLSACGFPDIGGFLSGVAASILRK